MLESIYNLLIILAFVSFSFAAIISCYEKVLQSRDRDSLAILHKIIFSVIASVLFIFCLANVGNITTIDTGCGTCRAPVDVALIGLFGFFGIFSLLLTVVWGLSLLGEYK